jgi:hypothetical protein
MASLPTRSTLVQALADAGRVHHEFEMVALKGVRDELWAGFYAAFVLGRLGDFTTASSLSRLLTAVAAPADWSDAAATHVLAALA